MTRARDAAVTGLIYAVFIPCFVATLTVMAGALVLDGLLWRGRKLTTKVDRAAH